MGASLQDRALVASPPEPVPVSALTGNDPSRGFLIKPFRVSVDGFSPQLYYAASRALALRDAWWGYRNYREVTFKEWLRMARCWREDEIGDQFGAPITVCGKPAFFVTHNNQYVQFSRPGGTEYFNAHPFDVEPAEFRPWTYRRDSDAVLARRPEGAEPRSGGSAGPQGIARKDQP
ncbi:hypothetical protein [Sphingobium sp. EP60837]|uniref:hypothetical protein n=1 Tax=Sphingobium sp. EP60837 TaxID=1855519 RepID=UPI0012E8F1AA|nr:hypothetical protein [Sphingobium sp. EP60837]